MVKRIIFPLMTLFLVGCWYVPKEYITTYGTYKHTDSDKLRIDGYYYHIDSVDYNGNPTAPMIEWFMLYENGTLLQSFNHFAEFKGFDNFEEIHFINYPEVYDYNEFSEKKSTWWGAYNIEDSIITFQHFVFYDHWLAIERKGEITKQNQIFMYSSKSLSGKYKDNESYTHKIFQFKRFEKKPDSLNWMMFDKYYN